MPSRRPTPIDDMETRIQAAAAEGKKRANGKAKPKPKAVTKKDGKAAAAGVVKGGGKARGKGKGAVVSKRPAGNFTKTTFIVADFSDYVKRTPNEQRSRNVFTSSAHSGAKSACASSGVSPTKPTLLLKAVYKAAGESWGKCFKGARSRGLACEGTVAKSDHASDRHRNCCPYQADVAIMRGALGAVVCLIAA